MLNFKKALPWRLSPVPPLLSIFVSNACTSHCLQRAPSSATTRHPHALQPTFGRAEGTAHAPSVGQEGVCGHGSSSVGCRHAVCAQVSTCMRTAITCRSLCPRCTPSPDRTPTAAVSLPPNIEATDVQLLAFATLAAFASNVGAPELAALRFGIAVRCQSSAVSRKLPLSAGRAAIHVPRRKKA